MQVNELSEHVETSISIIIPAKNKVKNIIHLLSDILQQDYPKELFEVIIIDEELAELIKSGSISTPEMLEQKGIKTLSHNAFELFEKGETSLEEIYPLLMN